MEQVSSLIMQKLKVKAEAEDHHLLQSKYKAISALLPYVLQYGQPEMVDIFLHGVKASRTLWFI